MHDDDCCDDDGDLKAWRLSWIDPCRWMLSVVNGLGQVITNTSTVIVEDLIQHAKWVKEREDFKANAGRDIEMLVSGE